MTSAIGIWKTLSSDMKTKEIEEYKELLCQLEPSSENEYDDLPKVMS